MYTKLFKLDENKIYFMNMYKLLMQRHPHFIEPLQSV